MCVCVCACSCKRPTTEGYYCPRCGAKSCHIPCGCPICGLFLLASYHLAKSYHHLFSLPQYNEVSALPPCSSSSSFTTTATASVKHHPKHTPARVSSGQPCYCYGCSMRITPPAWQCSACNKIFCGECEIYVHETLFNCPGCMEAKK